MAACQLGGHGDVWTNTSLFWCCPQCVAQFHLNHATIQEENAKNRAQKDELARLKRESKIENRRPLAQYIPIAVVVWLMIVIPLLILL